MPKKILLVDDSALMRRFVCDIISQDGRFVVADTACNGIEALELLERNSYDAVILDVNMPKLSGIGVLQELNKRQIRAKVMMNSSMTSEGAAVTIEALELGALDFIQKPEKLFDTASGEYQERLLNTLNIVVNSVIPGAVTRRPSVTSSFHKHVHVDHGKSKEKFVGRIQKLVAIASSTGGPKALQTVISKLPDNLNAPVVIVQHMPAGFTASLAERLNGLSKIKVREAVSGDILEVGKVYIARGGSHLKIQYQNGQHRVLFTDEPPREGVKPSANYMFESLRDSDFEEIVCVVLTGMGADGTKGIKNLDQIKNLYVIAQEQSTCVVYGMPRAIVESGLVDQILPIEEIAQGIITNVGVR